MGDDQSIDSGGVPSIETKDGTEATSQRNNMDHSEHRFLTHYTENGVIILTFTKSMLNADAVKEAISVVNSSESRKVIFDFQAIRHFHNPPIVLFHKRLTEEGGRMVLCNVHPDIAELLQITRLNQLFEIQPDIGSAVACMGRPAETKKP